MPKRFSMDTSQGLLRRRRWQLPRCRRFRRGRWHRGSRRSWRRRPWICGPRHSTVARSLSRWCPVTRGTSRVGRSLSGCSPVSGSAAIGRTRPVSRSPPVGWPGAIPGPTVARSLSRLLFTPHHVRHGLHHFVHGPKHATRLRLPGWWTVGGTSRVAGPRGPFVALTHHPLHRVHHLVHGPEHATRLRLLGWCSISRSCALSWTSTRTRLPLSDGIDVPQPRIPAR